MTTVVFDFETAGIRDDQPSIQLASIAMDDVTGAELDSFERKIKFDVALSDPKALEMNHYSAEAWKDAKAPGLVAAEFARWLQPYLCIEMMSKRTGAPYFVAKGAGYNAVKFDWPRLQSLFGAAFLPVSYHVRDVLQRAMWYFDEHPDGGRPKDLKLGSVCEFFGIGIEGAHDALFDCRLTAKLARRLRH